MKILGGIRKRHIRTQPVGHQPAPEIAHARPLAVQQIAGALPQHEEIVQELALGRQQRRVDGLRLGHALDIVGDQPLQEGAGLGPVDGNDPALFEHDIEGLTHRRNPVPLRVIAAGRLL